MFLSFNSCNKNDTLEKTILNGIVVNYPSRQPMQGIKVYLITSRLTLLSTDDSNHWKIRYTDTVTNSHIRLMDSVISDANGRFSFSYIPSNTPEGYDPTYQTAIIKPNLIRVYTGPIFTNNSNIDTVLVDAASYFRLNMHKISPANSNDTLFEKRIFTYLSTPSWFTWQIFRTAQVGQTNSTILDAYSYNQSHKVNIEWRYYRNGLQQSGLQTVNLIPNDTTKIDIYY